MPSGFLGGGIGPRAFGGGGLPDPVPVLGAELIVNGNMETGDPPTGWTAEFSATLSAAADERTGGSGAKSLDAVRGTNDVLTRQTATVASATWHIASAFVKSASGLNTGLTVGGTVLAATTGASWLNGVLSLRSTSTSLVTLLYINGSGGNGRYDDISLRPLALASLLSTRAYASADCDLSVGVTRTAGTQAGLCARLDSASSPANFIIAYETGAGRVKVDKCVAGVYTNIIDGAVTYSAGATLRLVCSGNNVSAYYNGTQVGTTQTVSDAGIVSNTRHGLFSTNAANTFTGYTAA